MDETQEKPKRRFKLTCCGIISIDCGGLVILFVVFVALTINDITRVSTQEHLPTSDFAPVPAVLTQAGQKIRTANQSQHGEKPLQKI